MLFCTMLERQFVTTPSIKIQKVPIFTRWNFDHLSIYSALLNMSKMETTNGIENGENLSDYYCIKYSSEGNR